MKKQIVFLLKLFLLIQFMLISFEPTSLNAQRKDPKGLDSPMQDYCICVSTQGAGFCALVCASDPNVGLCGGPSNGQQCGYCLPT